MRYSESKSITGGRQWHNSGAFCAGRTASGATPSSRRRATALLRAQEALSDLCYKLDIARPIWLDKHEQEVARFGRTAFTQEHFLEPIAFDKFEIEFLRPHGRSTDPRNDFGTNA